LKRYFDDNCAADEYVRYGGRHWWQLAVPLNGALDRWR
jgi:hypothetical protein